MIARYAALGDSFTAGTGCRPGEAWPERLAAGMRAHNARLELRNLAVEGATSGEVVSQLDAAVEFQPGLVTVVCGANDVLLSTRPDPRAYAENLRLMLRRLRASVPGVRLVTATSPERWDFLPLRPRTRGRVEDGIAQNNRATRVIAARLEVPCLDVAGHDGLSEPENFSADGLHPSPLGHRHAAEGFAALLAHHYGIDATNEGGRHQLAHVHA